MPQIIIAADICPIGENLPFFKKGEAQTLFNDLLPEFEQSDLVIANLECPLIERETPILKTGPVFGEDSSCVEGIRAAGVDLLTLANNHCMDHGAEGLRHTIKTCASAGIATVGAGENLAVAGQIFVREVGGVRVGVLGMAEHEFSIASQTTPGAFPADPLGFVRLLKREQSRYDYLIVLLHGGDEFHVPSPRIKDLCHFLVEMGANAVMVQHSHCLGGYEEYQGGHIVYGQGALIMDEGIYRNLKTFHDGYLVKLTVEKGSSARFEIIPFSQSDPQPGARKLTGEADRVFRQKLAERSNSILNDDWVESEWIRFCETRKHAYLSGLLGHNKILRKLNRRGTLQKLFYNRRIMLGVRNTVCCETHREAVQTIFDKGLV